MFAIAAALGFLWGTLPLGQWIAWALRRQNVRRLSVHNIGTSGLVRRLGWRGAILLLATDVVKGWLGLWLARQLSGSDWIAAVVSVVMLLGHLYSPYFLWRDGSPLRSRAQALAAGIWIGWASIGGVTPVLWLVPVALWGLVLLWPRWRAGRWGYLSLAAVAAALAAGLILVLKGSAAGILGGLALGILVPWRNKEHLARIVDGVEPRLGERLSATGPGEVSCAFLVHPMTQEDWWLAPRFRWAQRLLRMGLVSPHLLELGSHWMRPMKVDEIRGICTPTGLRARVHLLAAPVLPGTIKRDAPLALRRAIQAARLADQLGAQVLGLGAYWSVVGGKGLEVQRRSAIPVTNGGAYTAGAVDEAVPQIMDRLAERGVDLATATAAVVGANGVVGFGICRMIAPRVGTLIMVGTDGGRLERSAETIQRRYAETRVVWTTNLAELRSASVIFTATSQVEPVVFAEHVRPGTVLYDVGRPADVHPAVAEVPGVEVIPGGVVRLPGDVHFQIDLGYGSELVPACLAETVLIALEGSFDRCTVGTAARSENIRYFIECSHVHGLQVIIAQETDPAAAAAL